MAWTSVASDSAASSPTVQDSIQPSISVVDSSKDLESCTSTPGKRSILSGWFRRKPMASQTTVENLTSGKEDEDDKDNEDHEVYEDPYSTITRSLDACPDGYHRVATWQSSDSNFALFRSFAYSHCRVLCAWQNDISRLERKLDDLDHWDRTFGDEYKLSSQRRDQAVSKREKESGTFPAQFDSTRSEILAELRLKLMEYDEVLLKTREMMSLQKPSNRDYESVRNFFRDLQPIVREESNFIRCKEDLITLRSGREYAGFDTFVEACLSRLDKRLKKAPFHSNIVQRVFLTPELRAKTSDSTIHYYAPHRVERLVNMIIALIIFVIMVIPVFGMYWLSESDGNRRSPFEAFGILIISTLLFGATMSALTKAKRAELFAASAAYCAVLVVFITNFSTQTVSVNNPITVQGIVI